MDEKENGAPAFPVQDAASWQAHGMTLRQYAAIKLRVPDSGTDWLDDMIRQSLRDELAQKISAYLIEEARFSEDPVRAVRKAPEQSFMFATLWVKARGEL